MKRISVLILFLFFSAVAYTQEISYTVYFESDKYELPDTAMLKILKIISSQKIERVLLEGHCDNVGSKEYNYRLSENRANEVKKLIVQNGLEKESVKKCIGFGKDRPVTLNETELERQLNRRVLITFYVKESQKSIPKDTLIAITPKKKVLNKEMAKIAEAKIGENVVLDNILFQPGRHYLREESIESLQNLLNIMRMYPTLEIEIEGHVCCTTTEPDGYDWDLETNNLSVMRAREIYFILIRNGINKNRMRYVGYGGQRKINQEETTEEEKKINRRVEIKILNK